LYFFLVLYDAIAARREWHFFYFLVDTLSLCKGTKNYTLHLRESKEDSFSSLLVVLWSLWCKDSLILLRHCVFFVVVVVVVVAVVYFTSPIRPLSSVPLSLRPSNQLNPPFFHLTPCVNKKKLTHTTPNLPLSPSYSPFSITYIDHFGEGVIGWTIAFAARTPLFAFFSKTLSHSHDNLQEDLFLFEWSTLLSAGALEETTRLLLILFLGIKADFGAVYWLGLGWAGIETLYYIGQSLVYTRWLSSSSLSDDDYRAVAGAIAGVAASTVVAGAPTATTSLLASTNTSSSANAGPSTSISETPITLESGYVYGRGSTSYSKILHNNDSTEGDEELVPTREARHLLGLDRPWWSLMGRTSSMMVHIGLSCWLGHSGWRLLLPAAAVHGSLYVIWGVFMPEQWSVPATSYGTWIAALGVFLIGLALYGEIV
jgi:hypothetical protein